MMLKYLNMVVLLSTIHFLGASPDGIVTSVKRNLNYLDEC